MRSAESLLGLGEGVLLIAWLCAPWLFLALVSQLVYLARRGVLSRQRWLRVSVAVVGTLAATIVLAGVLLVVLPPRLLPNSLLPDHWPSPPPLRFFPGFVAATVSATVLGYWAARTRPPRETAR